MFLWFHRAGFLKIATIFSVGYLFWSSGGVGFCFGPFRASLVHQGLCLLDSRFDFSFQRATHFLVDNSFTSGLFFYSSITYFERRLFGSSFNLWAWNYTRFKGRSSVNGAILVTPCLQGFNLPLSLSFGFQVWIIVFMDYKKLWDNKWSLKNHDEPLNRHETQIILIR